MLNESNNNLVVDDDSVNNSSVINNSSSDENVGTNTEGYEEQSQLPEQVIFSSQCKFCLLFISSVSPLVLTHL